MSINMDNDPLPEQSDNDLHEGDRLVTDDELAAIIAEVVADATKKNR